MQLKSLTHNVYRTNQNHNVIRCLCKSSQNINLSKTFANQSNDTFDVIINGGGIVGLSFLLATQKSEYLKNKKILLLERQKPATDLISKRSEMFSNRVSSLTNSSRQFFDAIGIWNQLKGNAKRIDRMHVWSHDFNKAIRFRNEIDHSLTNLISDSTDIDVNSIDSVCHVLENDRILQALYDQIDAQHINFGQEVLEIENNQNIITLKTSDGSQLKTKLLIGCDGFKSLVRKSANFNYIERRLNQVGIVGTIKMDSNSIHSQNSIAYQRFLPSLNSVIALLPLDSTTCSFVLSTEPENAKKCMQMDDIEFTDYLNKLVQMHSVQASDNVLKWMIKKFDDVGSKLWSQQNNLANLPKIEKTETKSRSAFPLGFGTTAPNLVSSVHGSDFLNVALIGDAAHRIHPLAGQGLNLGLGDAQVLAECLHTSLSNGESLFSCPDNPLQGETLQQCLLSFEKQRLFKLVAIMFAVQTMPTVFEYTTSQMHHLFDQMSMLKRQIVQYANRS